MTRIFYKLAASFSLLTSLCAQESLFWEIADPIINSEFIEAYIIGRIKKEKLKKLELVTIKKRAVR